MPDRLPPLDPAVSLRMFSDSMNRDRHTLDANGWMARWLFADALAARGARADMSFQSYEGVSHLRKFFAWIQGQNFQDYLPDERMQPLVARSVERDTLCLSRLGVDVPLPWIEKVARYNAQDWCFQRLYPVPPRQQVKVLLDFGAGHGRMANLGLADGVTGLHRYIAIDAIPSTYLTQRAYFHGLGVRVVDYIDIPDAEEASAIASREADIIHVPTWRMDLIPSASIDMVCCVQVLKELPHRLVDWAIAQFARVIKPGGALYVRDHPQFHHPNHMPIDDLLSLNGFFLEFSPRVRDRIEVHGLPRIWRRYDVELLLPQDA